MEQMKKREYKFIIRVSNYTRGNKIYKNIYKEHE